MRPPTATLEAIKAYQKKVENNKITPDTLPPCPRCHLEPQYFKVHAYRERRFFIIVEAIIEAVYCAWFVSDVQAAARHSPFIRLLRLPTSTIPDKPLRVSAGSICKMIARPTKTL